MSKGLIGEKLPDSEKIFMSGHIQHDGSGVKIRMSLINSFISSNICSCIYDIFCNKFKWRFWGSFRMLVIPIENKCCLGTKSNLKFLKDSNCLWTIYWLYVLCFLKINNFKLQLNINWNAYKSDRKLMPKCIINLFTKCLYIYRC